MTTASAYTECRYCGSTNLGAVLCDPPSPHYARVFCSACKRTQGYDQAPMTPERAAAFVMPGGKHAGKTLAAINEAPGGAGYLAWLADRADGTGPSGAAAAFLEFKRR